MTDTALDNVKPVNDQTNPPAAAPAGPPPSNDERRAAREAEEAAKAKAEEQGTGKPEGQPQGGTEAPTGKPADEQGDPAPDNKESGDDDEAELDTSVWGDGEGDEVTVSLLTTLQNSGVTPGDAKALLFDAIQAGDPTKVDRDALVEKVGKHKATLIMAGVENITSKIQTQIKQTTELVHNAAGGKDNWDKARNWAQKGISEADLNEYRDMISKGGKQADYAVKQIIAAYNADPKNTSLNAKDTTVVGDSGGKAGPRKGISRSEYFTRKEKLHRSGRPTQAQLAELRELRNIGKKQGL